MTTAAHIERMLCGEPRALARLITAVENGTPETGAILAAIESKLGHARVVGVTGAPGVGKSTLVSVLVGELRRRGETVGVVAVDPSSPVSGGAILGDRIRMTAHAGDPGVFIRSVAARGHLGGLSAATAGIVDLMDAAGHDVVVVETVGAGQSEVEIAEVADCKVVVTAPGLGDDVQAIKAGNFEIADVLVVNKADLPNAHRTRDELRSMLRLRADGAANVAVLETTASEGAGVEALADAIFARWRHRPALRRADARRERTRRLLAGAASERIRTLIHAASGERIDRLSRDVRAGESSLDDAAWRLLKEFLGAPRVESRTSRESESA